jgi:hypothetical protein
VVVVEQGDGWCKESFLGFVCASEPDRPPLFHSDESRHALRVVCSLAGGLASEAGETLSFGFGRQWDSEIERLQCDGC